MKSSILELLAVPTDSEGVNWRAIVEAHYCPYLERECVKIRKTTPPVVIGTCSARYGVKVEKIAIICPHRFLERKQIFMDCFHLLTLHEPGNELHRVPELTIPGGSVDYVLASVKGGRVVDFVGIELQALDTTGSLWAERQRFLKSVGVEVGAEDLVIGTYGINWKMTAKTILMQLLHKVETFEHLSKHLVLILQEPLLNYMMSEFSFGHIEAANLGDSMHFHAYRMQQMDNAQYRLSLTSRVSTDASGIAKCLGLQVSPNIELEQIFANIQAKISDATLLTI